MFLPLDAQAAADPAAHLHGGVGGDGAAAVVVGDDIGDFGGGEGLAKAVGSVRSVGHAVVAVLDTA